VLSDRGVRSVRYEDCLTPKSDAPANDLEDLILVDADDNVLGHLDKASCHAGEGVRHRAFSVFLFDGAGRVLLQQRSTRKHLWPGFWSNSVCSHPRRGETIEQAAGRRVPEELGIRSSLHSIYRFEYHARDDGRGAEHELCWVLIGRVGKRERAEIRPDSDEIENLRWVHASDLDTALRTEPGQFTPWMRMEWPRLRSEHRDVVETMLVDEPTR